MAQVFGDDRLAADINRGSIDHIAMPKMPALGVYALIHRYFDISTPQSYGTPFDGPQLSLNLRL